MLETKRRVIGQLIVCQGCCCGATHKDRPEVPAEWLKDERRRRGLLKRFQLTVSGCVGPCDLPNVVEINSEAGSQWLGKSPTSINTGLWSNGLSAPWRQDIYWNCRVNLETIYWSRGAELQFNRLWT
jgi:hypothetical protein